MDVKQLVLDLPIPDTKDTAEVERYIVKLREILLAIVEYYESNNDKLNRQLDSLRQEVHIHSLQLGELDNKQLHDYKTKKYFDIFSNH